VRLPPLLIYGPPGVGKTHFYESLAKVLRVYDAVIVAFYRLQRRAGAVTAYEALAHLRAQYFIAEATSAPVPRESSVEAATRDTERLAHQIDRPSPRALTRGGA
jgi:MoxR-like ATPase